MTMMERPRCRCHLPTLSVLMANHRTMAAITKTTMTTILLLNIMLAAFRVTSTSVATATARSDLTTGAIMRETSFVPSSSCNNNNNKVGILRHRGSFVGRRVSERMTASSFSSSSFSFFFCRRWKWRQCLGPLRKNKSRTQLYYLPQQNNNEDADEDGSSASEFGGDPFNCHHSPLFRPQRPSVPMLGPIPMAPPLMVGSSMSIKPTPYQWSILEEAVILHQRKNGGTVLHAAPLVAIVDEVTGKRPMKVPSTSSSNRRMNGRYATLAAVMGVSSSPSSSSSSSTFSVFDSDFTEISSKVGSGSSVRLYGIGRAVLCEYFNRIPTASLEGEEGSDEEDDNDEEAEYDKYYSTGPIVMAEFELLMDSDTFPATDTNPLLLLNPSDDYNRPDQPWGKPLSRGKKKQIFPQENQFSSPIHAINKLSTISNRLYMMHDSRRKLVAGLVAATQRLKNRQREQREGYKYDNKDEYNESELAQLGSSIVDYDALDDDEYNKYEDSQVEMSADDLISIFLPKQKQGGGGSDTDSDNPNERRSRSDNPYYKMGKKYEKMNNYYGLQYYSAFTSLQSLTNNLMKDLSPYYSKTHQEREEYIYETLSFVCWKALESVVSMEDVCWSLQCTSSKERLQRAYEIMTEHRLALEQLAEEISEELNDCGEECTDLW